MTKPPSGSNVELMRFLRLMSALVLAVALAILPVSAATAMTHAAKAEMSMSSSGDDCPCCDVNAADACSLKCCQLQALTIDALDLLKAEPEDFDPLPRDLAIAVSLQPDPPPPRS